MPRRLIFHSPVRIHDCATREIADAVEEYIARRYAVHPEDRLDRKEWGLDTLGVVLGTNVPRVSIEGLPYPVTVHLSHVRYFVNRLAEAHEEGHHRRVNYGGIDTVRMPTNEGVRQFWIMPEEHAWHLEAELVKHLAEGDMLTESVFARLRENETLALPKTRLAEH